MKSKKSIPRVPAVMRMVSTVSVIVLLLLFLPDVSPGVSLTGDSSTYLLFRETTDKSKLAPLYEYLDMSLDNVGDSRVSFHFGGWGKYDLKDESYGRRFDTDLQYAFLSFKNDKNNAVINLGRVMVFEGVAAERLDGLYARTDLKSGFGVSAFAGNPVESDLNGVKGDFIYGGRVFYQIPAVFIAGASYLKETDSGYTFREEAGADVWLRPIKKVEITGRSSYNGDTSHWMEHAYALSLGPFANFRLNSEVSWISYKDYFTPSSNPAFKLFTGFLDPAEKVLILGQSVSYSINESMVVSADYKKYDYDIAGDADYYGGKFAYTVPGKGGAGVSFHRMQGGTDKLRYDEFRVYGFKKFGKADLTLDFIDIDYDQQINGLKNAYTASLIAGYDLTKKLRMAADIDYSRNPIYSKDIRSMLKLVCRFDSVFGGEKGAK